MKSKNAQSLLKKLRAAEQARAIEEKARAAEKRDYGFPPAAERLDALIMQYPTLAAERRALKTYEWRLRAEQTLAWLVAVFNSHRGVCSAEIDENSSYCKQRDEVLQMIERVEATPPALRAVENEMLRKRADTAIDRLWGALINTLERQKNDEALRRDAQQFSVVAFDRISDYHKKTGGGIDPIATFDDMNALVGAKRAAEQTEKAFGLIDKKAEENEK